MLVYISSDIPVYMEMYNFYFLKLLMKENNGTDFLSVGVDGPGGLSAKPIRSPYLYLNTPGTYGPGVYRQHMWGQPIGPIGAESTY